MPEVMLYTVMIIGYVVFGKLEKAQEMLHEMISKQKIHNVFTYKVTIS